MKRLMFFILVSCLLISDARANVSNGDAIKAIAGEAEGEGARGMLAVACAIRNRGTLKGVYGRKAPRVVKGKVAPEKMKQAADAWKKSAKKDITGGADHWHNVRREGPRKWTKEYKKTAEIGQHVFYKSKKEDRMRYIK